MKRRRVLSAALVLAAPCVAPFAVAQDGASRSYTPGVFDAIDISGSAVVSFTQGEPESVVVKGDEDTQRSVSLDLRGTQLSIRPGGSWKFWNDRRLQVSVTARDLRRVSISGAADLLVPQPLTVGRLSVHISGAGLARLDQLKAERLDFHVSGAGDGQVAGSVGELGVHISGRGDFKGEHLAAQRVKVSVSGIGDVKVWALQELDISVSGIGTVDYWGQPRLRRSSSGLSKVNDRGPKQLP